MSNKDAKFNHEILPLYTSHKKVRAGKILYTKYDVRTDKYHVEMTYGADGKVAGVLVDSNVFSRHEPQQGDYLVFYPDGYISVSPAAAFEEGYTRDE